MYYQLYADSNEMPSKVAIDPDKPSLGRIRADYIAPPLSLNSIKRCISRVEGNPAFSYVNLFADTTYDTPLKDGHISILRTDGPVLPVNPNGRMAIVQVRNRMGSISLKIEHWAIIGRRGIIPARRSIFCPQQSCMKIT